MIKRFLLFSVLGVALTSAVLEAKEARIQRGDHGPADVVKRECGDVGWTAEALWQSRIMDPNHIFKVGDVILLPDQCKTQKPTKEVRRATKKLFALQREHREVKQIQADSLADHERLGDALNNWNQEKQRADWLAGEKVTAERERDAARRDLKKELQKSHGFEWKGFLFGIIFGLAVGMAGVWVCVVRRLTKENERLKESNARLRENADEADRDLAAARTQLKTVMEDGNLGSPDILYHGDPARFRRVVTFVECLQPGCGARDIKDEFQNKHSHLDRVHPELRMRKVPSEVMDERFATVG